MTTEHVAVTNFRKYLRINTEQPNPNYAECKDFLLNYAAELSLETWSYECVTGKPIVGFTLKGTDESLPSLLLYSHTDVVPTFPEHWKYDPYSATKEANGDIYARGTQDMKCVGIQYIEALRILLKEQGRNFLRSIHILWGPDEEIGGVDGMQKFVRTECFRQLNVGFALDEGVVSEDDVYRLFYAERSPWWVKITCCGSPGHGSRFLENTSGPKLTSIINSFNDYRNAQQKRLQENPEWTIGDVTSVNLTKVQGGVQVNVIPSELCAWFDIRITPHDKFDDIEALIRNWCEKAGEGVTFEFEQRSMINATTPNTKADPWWNALATALEENGCKIKPEIFLGAIDARYLRELGYKAVGFTPIINTPQLLHDHNEFLGEEQFLRGVEIYVKVIEKLANLRDA